MLESLKKDVVAMAKRAQKEGLCKHLSGNLSARDPETGYVVITPTQVDRDLLTARDMVVLDLDANVIENESGLRPEFFRMASSRRFEESGYGVLVP